MKVIRMLIYKGSEEEIEKHLSQTYIKPDKPYLHSSLVIREIFRGEQKDSEVVHLDEDEIPS